MNVIFLMDTARSPLQFRPVSSNSRSLYSINGLTSVYVFSSRVCMALCSSLTTRVLLNIREVAHSGRGLEGGATTHNLMIILFRWRSILVPFANSGYY